MSQDITQRPTAAEVAELVLATRAMKGLPGGEALHLTARRLAYLYDSASTPVAWLHILDNTEGIPGNKPRARLTFSENHPFGTPGVDYSEEFSVTSVPLYKGQSNEQD